MVPGKFVVLLVSSILFGLSASVSTSTRTLGSSISWNKPWFCHNSECPEYEVLESRLHYEKRKYKKGLWVSTRVESHLYPVATSIGFRRLFGYITGDNEDGIEINMTSPVRVTTMPSSGPFCKQNFTVSFFVPTEFHEAGAPIPTDPNVYIDPSDEMTVYVGSAGGFKVDDFSISRMLDALVQDLDQEGVRYQSEPITFAGYDPPFRLRNRHNEVWLFTLGTNEQLTRVQSF
eukprot:jgi/Picsp_1/709/NSC_00703-R1_heme-binding protein 2-like